MGSEYFFYHAKGNATGLTDITATVTRNGIKVAEAVALNDLSSFGLIGVYMLTLTGAMLENYGGSGAYMVRIDSVSNPAPAITYRTILGVDQEDLETHLLAQDAALSDIMAKVDSTGVAVLSMDSKIDTVQTTLDDRLYSGGSSV